MSNFEFGNPLNWNLISRLDLQASKVPNNPDFYYPISSKSVVVTSRILMVGCRSDGAKSTWWLGCRVSKRLLISPSSTSQFPSAVHTDEQKRCPLNTLTLIKFNPEGPSPYLLMIDVPEWLAHLYVEVWGYDGPDDALSTNTIRILENG
jgi:hypothetical protein